MACRRTMLARNQHLDFLRLSESSFAADGASPKMAYLVRKCKREFDLVGDGVCITSSLHRAEYSGRSGSESRSRKSERTHVVCAQLMFL
jgi:hypothetical protein